MSNPDVARAVEAAMTETERKSFLSIFTRLNPRWTGAKVADVLDSLDSVDAHLEVTEPILATYGEEVEEPGLLYMACLAAIYAYDTARDPAETFVHARTIIDRMRTETVDSIEIAACEALGEAIEHAPWPPKPDEPMVETRTGHGAIVAAALWRKGWRIVRRES